jgi:hypothetical protein
VSTPHELALAESVRAIELQSRSLDELRTRTGVLIAATSVVASFLGSEVLKTTSFGVLTGLAVVSFGVGLVACLAVLWPREWRFALGANVLLEDWADEPRCGDDQAMSAFIARVLEKNWFANKKQIDNMLILFEVAVGALGIEFLFWTIQLAERG